MLVALIKVVGETVEWVMVAGAIVVPKELIGLAFVFSNSSFFFFKDEEAQGDVRDFLFNLEQEQF